MPSHPYLELAARTLEAWGARTPELAALRRSLGRGRAAGTGLAPERLLPRCLRPGGPAAATYSTPAQAELMALEEARCLASFAGARGPGANVRLELAEAFGRITDSVDTLHRSKEMTLFARKVLDLGKVPGCLVEAGAYKGSGTAKLSLIARAAARPLFVFDTFAGLPQAIKDRSITGQPMKERRGAFSGSLPEVRSAVRRYGWPRACRYVPGLIEDTLKGFDRPVAAAFLDVDLASPVRHCLKVLYPLLSPGGFLLSHDGRFGRVVRLLSDRRFWKEEVGFERPRIEGLGREKILVIEKPRAAR